MTKIKKEKEYGEEIRKYFFTFAGYFVGFVALVFITNLESKIFFTGFILLIAGFVGFFIYSFYVSRKLANKREIILAQSIADLKDMKEGNDDQKQKYTEQDLLDMLNSIAEKQTIPVVKSKASIFDDIDERNKRLDRLDRTLGTSFRSPIWSKHE